MQVQGHPRVALAEGGDDRRQGIARLGVGGGDGQVAAIGLFELGRDIENVVGLLQQPGAVFQNALPGRRDLGEMLAVAHEDLDAQFIFQQSDLLGDAAAVMLRPRRATSWI